MPSKPMSAFLLAFLLVVAGCGGAQAPPQAAPSPSPAQAPVPAPVVTTTPPHPPSSAADGADVGACRDGDCEIAVDGPVRIDLPLGAVYVTSVSAQGVELGLPYESDGETGRGYVVSLDGFCSASSEYLRAAHFVGYTPAVTRCTNVPEPLSDASSRPGTLTMQTSGRAGGAVILRLHGTAG